MLTLRPSTGLAAAMGAARVVLVTFALLLCMAALATADARACSAAPLGISDFYNAAGSCFEGGDGNLDADVPGLVDWADVGDETLYSDPTGSGDEGQFTQGSKELEPGTWTLTPSEPNDKSDITALATRTERAEGDVFLHLAFTTRGDTGSMNASIELNQDPSLWDNGNGDGAVIPTRGEGDLLITYDGNQFASERRIGICVWKGNKYGQGSGGASDYGWQRLDGTPIGGAVKDCTPVAQSDAVAGFNDTGALDNTGNAKLGAPFDETIAQDTFGELSFNISSLIGDNQGDVCFDFGSLWVHTREGNSVTAAMEDYVRPRPLIGADNCGGAIDKKVAVGDPAGPYHEGTPTDPSSAQAGQTLYYTIAITNTGTLTFTPTVTDPNCDSAPVRVAPNDADATFDPGDTWHYACQHVLRTEDVDPFTNTAYLHGQIGSFVIDEQDSTDTTRIPTVPAIAIVKTGPATAIAGELVTYTLNVTDPGNTSFADGLVVVTDPLCQAPPALVTKNGDPSPQTLDPGDRWTYQCQVQTQQGQTQIDNVATVHGTDQGGRVVEASSNAVTTLSQPASATSPVPSTPVLTPAAAARLNGTVACATATYSRASVAGSQIRRVTFRLNGRKVSTLTAPNRGGRYELRLRTRSLSYGTYKVTARVEFTPQSRTPARTLRLQFSRCAPRIVKPVFTG